MNSNTKKLSELDASFINAGGPGILKADLSPSTPRKGVGVMMDCPCGNCGAYDEGRGLYVPFKNPVDGGPMHDDDKIGWQRTGDTIETLTLKPSVLRSPDKGGCGWHGFITDGEARSC